VQRLGPTAFVPETMHCTWRKFNDEFYLLGYNTVLLFNPEDGGDMFLLDVDGFSVD
jgi:hypothetical protein